MSTLKNKRSNDPFDRLIFEKGLRIENVIPEKKLGIMVIILNNGNVLRVDLSTFKSLKKASQIQLNKWNLISNGIGIEWNDLDEDLSLKGIIKDAALNSALDQLEGKPKMDLVI